VKHLPKHLQPRWRYLAVGIETWPDAEFDRGAFQRHLWYAAQNLLGEAASAAMDLRVLRFELASGAGQAVVQVRRGEVERARAALACLDAVDGAPVGVRVRGASGTVRACEEKYIRDGPEAVAERTVAFEDDQRTAVVRSPRYDVATPDGFAGATTLDI
jgi:ribonuclease P/MRP protein subunit POP5